MLALSHTCRIHIQLPTQRRGLSVLAASGKGFGTTKPPAKPAKVKSRKKPQRQTQFIEDDRQQRTQPQTPRQREAAARGGSATQQSIDSRASDPGFEQRLSRLAGQQQHQGNANSQQEEPRDVFALEPQFGRPQQQNPSSSQSSQPSAKDDGDAEGGVLSSGFAKAAGFAGAVVLIIIFLVSSVGGGDGGSPVSDEAQMERLGQQQRDEVTAQAALFDATLETSPDDLEALEGAAVCYTKLGDLTKATQLLIQLSKLKPDDEQVWRLLAETQAFQGNRKAALETYEIGNRKSNGQNIDILSGWVDVLLAEGRQQQAVDVVKAARKNGQGDKDVAFDQDLLLARVFARWKGHNAEALTIYDRLAEEDPEDFRVPLSKGSILKGEGRAGDAARYFMKARYLAPSAARRAVDAVIAEQ